MASTSNYSRSSPYYSTPSFGKFLDILDYRPIDKQPDDVVYVINNTYQYRPDLLAYDLYNDSKLWWVFAGRNPNTLGPDPYFKFTAGTGIYIPTLATLREVLGV